MDKYADFYKNVYNISSYNCADDINKYDFNLFGLYEDNENPHSFINIILQMCLVEYETDYGYVFPDLKTEAYFQQANFIGNSIDLRVQTGAAKFGQISIYMSKDLTKYQRKYTKMQEVIASIGGFLNAILFGAGAIVGFVTRRIFLIRIANDSYVLKSKDKKKIMTMATISQRRKTDNNMMSVPEEGRKSIFARYFNKNDPDGDNILATPMASAHPGGGNLQMSNINIMTNQDEINKQPPQLNDNTIKEAPDIKMSEIDTPIRNSNFNTPDITRSVLKSQTQSAHKDFHHSSIDENGKVRISWRNIFWPDKAVDKIYRVMEKKSGIDDVLGICSQVEKIKRYLFTSNEELEIFNNLPDLNVLEIMPGKKENFDLKTSLMAMVEKKPDAKILEVIEKL